MCLLWNFYALRLPSWERATSNHIWHHMDKQEITQGSGMLALSLGFGIKISAFHLACCSGVWFSWVHPSVLLRIWVLLCLLWLNSRGIPRLDLISSWWTVGLCFILSSSLYPANSQDHHPHQNSVKRHLLKHLGVFNCQVGKHKREFEKR